MIKTILLLGFLAATQASDDSTDPLARRLREAQTHHEIVNQAPTHEEIDWSNVGPLTGDNIWTQLGVLKKKNPAPATREIPPMTEEEREKSLVDTTKLVGQELEPILTLMNYVRANQAVKS